MWIDELKTLVPNGVITGAECLEYSTDASNTACKRPADAVAFVETVEQVQNVVRLAQKHRLPLICRGAGTNVVGACLTENGGIVLSFEKMNKIIEINKENMTVRVQPGVVVGELQAQVEKLGLYFPPDPSALAISTIGGGIAQASAGARTFKYGAIKDYVLGLTVVTADGELLQTGSNTIKNATGYNLTSLFVGSEGTLGVVVEAALKLIPAPAQKQVVLAYFDTVGEAIAAVNTIIESKIRAAVIDFMDKNALKTTGISENKEAALIIELDEDIDAAREAILKILPADVRYSRNDTEYEEIWAARRSSWEACAKLKPHVTTDDVIVPRDKLAQLVEGIQKICTKHGLTSCMVGHVGDGSVHPQIPVDLNDADECARLKLAKEEIYDLTASLGGLLSGEHGIGALKKPYLHKVIDPLAIKYMREIKKVFDPHNILNPGKIF